jgi:D-cysteine desulfhydrase family pyridoxal phosphate-dependent enzyme
MIETKKVYFPLLETPIQELPSLSHQTGVHISIKRDDLNGIGLGGNKIRKLAYLVQDAKDKGATRLLTTGGVQTNHGRLTAAVAAMCGIKCTIVLVGQEPERYSGNLILNEIFGADLVFAAPENWDATIEKTRQKLEQNGDSVYTIPLGGSSPLGLLGYVEAAIEIQHQLDKQQQSIDYLVTAYGTGGTYGGLLLGSKLLNNPFEVLGMNVLAAPTDEVSVQDSLLALMAETSEQYSLGQTIRREDLRITMESVGPGYNQPDTKTVETVVRVARSEGVLLDYCYTGKAFDSMLRQIEKGVIPTGSRVLFLHTGGSPALFAEQNLTALENYLSKN